MKTTTLLLLPLVLAAAPALPLAADPGHGHGHSHTPDGKPEWAALFGDAPSAVAWRSASAARDRIEAALKAEKLAGVDAWAQTIHLAAHALADQVKPSDEAAQKRLAAALGQAGKLADEVLDAAQHNNARRAAASFTRLKSALGVAEGRLPAELIEAAAKAEPRFAAAPKHDPHHH